MSWTAIRDALKTRLESALAGLANVHGYQEWTDDAPASKDWETLFSKSGKIHFWEITREARRSFVSPLDPTVRILRYDVGIMGYFAHHVRTSTPSEDSFNAAVELVGDDLEDGDRTLGGAAICYSDPDFQQIGYSDVNGAFCHFARCVITVEEEVAVTTSPDSDLAELTDAGVQESEYKEVGNRLISALQPGVSLAGLGTLDWARSQPAEPIFPPSNLLDGARLRPYFATSTARSVGGLTGEVQYVYRLHAYLLQTPGEDTAERALRAAKRIIDRVASEGYTARSLRGDGFEAREVSVDEEWGDDIPHEVWPGRRVTPIILQFTVRGSTVNC